jgi:hypothetical protein
MDRIQLSKAEKRDFINKNPKCVYCGCKSKFLLTIDHKTPLARGGKDIEKNKQVTCMICNHLKNDMTHMEFKKYFKVLNDLEDLNKIRVPLFSLNFVFKAYNRISPPLPPPAINNNKRLEDENGG